MEPRRVTFNRWFVGGLAAVCFLAAAGVAAFGPEEEGLRRFWWGGFLRGGIVLIAFWFCLPTKGRPAAWADFSPLSAALFAAAVLLTILRPKAGIPLLILFLAARAAWGLFRRRR